MIVLKSSQMMVLLFLFCLSLLPSSSVMCIGKWSLPHGSLLSHFQVIIDFCDARVNSGVVSFCLGPCPSPVLISESFSRLSHAFSYSSWILTPLSLGWSCPQFACQALKSPPITMWCLGYVLCVSQLCSSSVKSAGLVYQYEDDLDVVICCADCYIFLGLVAPLSSV